MSSLFALGYLIFFPNNKLEWLGKVYLQYFFFFLNQCYLYHKEQRNSFELRPCSIQSQTAWVSFLAPFFSQMIERPYCLRCASVFICKMEMLRIHPFHGVIIKIK